jgi:hypothetical protein
MKAISIRQPWAFLILNHGKDIENRKWKTSFRGRVLIHASKTIDEEAVKLHGLENVHFPTGCIVGSIEIKDVVTESESRWFTGPFGFVLENPEKITPFPAKGKLNIFEINEVLK